MLARYHVSFAILVLALPGLARGAEAAAAKPNILLILADAYLLTQAFGGGRTLAIRRGAWKYIAHRDSGGNNYDNAELKRYALPDTAPDAPGQLYNLSADPGEKTNLHFKHPEIVKELKGLLDASKASGRSNSKTE